MSTTRLVAHALPALALLLVLSRHTWVVVALVRTTAWLCVRMLQLVGMLVGSSSVWWFLRSHQLQHEQELVDQAWSRYRLHQRSLPRTSSDRVYASPTGLFDASGHLHARKRLPVATHLRTVYDLPPPLSDELAHFIQSAIREYVTYWFAPLSPANDDFPNDVQLVLSDLLGAFAARIVALESHQALAVAASAAELVRLHLGWFRELFAQVEADAPDAFTDGSETAATPTAHLTKRQALVAARAQQSRLLHPGCLIATSTNPKSETHEIAYLRHVAAQMLVALEPALLQQTNGNSNVCASLVLNLLREAVTFKVLKPLAEYAQPQFANSVVLAALQSMLMKETAPLSPPGSSQSQSVSTTTFHKLRVTTNYLYKATQRSSEQAEAAFQAVVDVVSSAATAAVSTSATTSDWTDRYSVQSPSHSALHTPDRKSQAFASLFASLDEHKSSLSVPKVRTPHRRPFLPGGTSSKSTVRTSTSSTAGGQLVPPPPPPQSPAAAASQHLKANLGSSLNKVKRRFRTLSGHPQDVSSATAAVDASERQTTATTAAAHAPTTTMPLSSVVAATRLMSKRPGLLFPKALRRPSSQQQQQQANRKTNKWTTMRSPVSPLNAMDDLLTPPPLSEDDDATNRFYLGRESEEEEEEDDDDNASLAAHSPLTPTHETLLEDEERAMETADDDDFGVDATVEDNESDADDCEEEEEEEGEEEEGEEGEQAEEEDVEATRSFVVEQLAKATTNYVRMGIERPPMRSSARAKELWDLVTALEAVYALGLRRSIDDDDDDDACGDNSDSVLLLEDEDDGALEHSYWRYLATRRVATPFLALHTQFIARQCPPCISTSYRTTRGVQWLLVAFERGSLWEFATALHLDRVTTAKYYDPQRAVLHDAARMERVLQSLFPLTKAATLLEIPRELGRQSDVTEVFGVALVASATRQHQQETRRGATPAAVCILERVWEGERYVPLNGWSRTIDKRWHDLPSSEWRWLSDDWRLVTTEWEYATTFDDKFHIKERKIDAVRRRQWVRRRQQLPLVLTAVAAAAAAVPTPNETTASRSHVRRASYTRPTTASSSPQPPPALFGAASLPQAPATVSLTVSSTKVRNIKQLFDATKRNVTKQRTEGEAPTTTGSRSLLKRRSNSFDKSLLTSPLADLLLASPPLIDTALLLPQLPATTTTRKRRSIPSLRRSNSSSSKDVKAALALARATTTGSTTTQQQSHSLLASPVDDALLTTVDRMDTTCFCCLRVQNTVDSDATNATTATTDAWHACESCQQRVCAACHAFFAFASLPPPLETTRKTRVCAACYERFTSRYRIRIDAHVSKCFSRTTASASDAMTNLDDAGSDHRNSLNGVSPPIEIESVPSSPTATRTTASPVFEVIVFAQRDPSNAWSVVKTFSDFETLERQLRDKLRLQERKFVTTGVRGSHWKGIDYSELLDVAPQLRSLPVAALTYTQRLYVLEAFIQSVLARDTLAQSPAVHKFLQLDRTAAAVGSTGAAASPSLTPQTNDCPSVESPRGSSTNPNGVLLMETGKWRKGKWIAPATQTRETKVRLLQTLEVALFAVVGEVFEFDAFGVVKRQLFAMTRSFVKAFLSASHFRKLERQFQTLTDPTRVASLVVALREYAFPDVVDSDNAAAPAPAPTQLTAREIETLRQETLDAIVASFPSTLVSLFGETSCETAALKLHEFLQHEVFVKSLLFSIADELLLQLFPDFVAFKPRAQAASK